VLTSRADVLGQRVTLVPGASPPLGLLLKRRPLVRTIAEEPAGVLSDQSSVDSFALRPLEELIDAAEAPRLGNVDKLVPHRPRSVSRAHVGVDPDPPGPVTEPDEPA
jgi:hypothetical protein